VFFMGVVARSGGRRKKGLLLIASVVLCLVLAIGGVCLIAAKRKRLSSALDARANIRNTKETKDIVGGQNDVVFLFIIPFEGMKRGTYVLLSVRFDMKDKRLKNEIVNNRSRLRAMIYDSLKGEIDKGYDVPSLEKLTSVIVSVSNKALPRSRACKVHIDKLEVI